LHFKYHAINNKETAANSQLAKCLTRMIWISQHTVQRVNNINLSAVTSEDLTAITGSK